LPTVDAGADQTVCAGTNVTLTGSGAASYAWDNGVTNATAFAANATATYTVTGTDANNCTATDAVVITVNPLPMVDAGADQTVCAGTNVTLTLSGAYYYDWDNGVINGTAFAANTTTTYTVTATDATTCTATDQVVITVNPLPMVDAGADQTVCAGTNVTLTGSGASTFTWDNSVADGTAFSPTSTATYTVTGTDANGCIGTDNIDVTVNTLPTVSAGADQAVCDGGAVTLSGSGASIYAWDNGVNDGASFTPTATATYTVTGTDANGCIGTDNVDVTVNALPTVSAGADQAVCNGGAVTLSGSGAIASVWDNGITDGASFTPTATATYTLTGTDINNCTGTDQVDVTVNAKYYNISTISLCTGDSVLAEGAYQLASGTFYDSLSSMAGCDSVIETVLTVSSQITVNIPLSICLGDSALINGNYELASGTFSANAVSVAGCDSVTITNLTVNPVVTNSVTSSICQGDSMMLAGAYQITAGSYDELYSTANGCDSIVTTTLNVSPAFTNNLTASICQGDSMMLAGAYQTTAGSYNDLYSTANGCDSIVTTDLTVNDVNYLTESITVCFGDSSFIAGSYQTVSGVYADSLTNANGCDSIIETTFTVLNENFTTNLVSVCTGDSVLAGGGYQTTTGLFYDILLAASGCDSIIETDLTVSSQITVNLPLSICQGDSALINGSYELSSGAFYDTTVSLGGCDSVTITNLTVNLSLIDSVSVSICQGDSLLLGGAYQTASGSYDDVYFTASGCDSLVTTTLTVNTASSFTDTQQAACDFTWIDGVTYTASNSTATFTTSNALGCDSVVTLDLTINPIVATIAQNGNDIEASATNGAAPYSYDWSTGETAASITPPANGPYWVVVSDVDACLSDTTSFDVTFVSGTGIVNWNNSISIYPNPTSDVVTISKGNYTGVSKVNIYDLFGRKVFTSSDKEISLKSFADGVYVLEVKVADKSYTTRIIKE
jgi:hypothetical protein